MEDDTCSVWSDYSESLTSEQHELIDMGWNEHHKTDNSHIDKGKWSVNSTPASGVYTVKSSAPSIVKHGRVSGFSVGWSR